MLKKLARQALDVGMEPLANALPSSVVRRLVSEATIGLKVALCMHRVLERPRPFMLQPELAHTDDDIDSFLELFSDVPSRLTMSFDDGYEDARAYISSRAPAHPEVTWLFMVCPAKTKERYGFAWDAYRQAGETDALKFQKISKETANRSREHEKKELANLADDADYLLSSVDACRDLATLENVELGNHTDHHIPTAWMPDDDVKRELVESRDAFTELFGPPRHFAFPYGTPNLYVLPRDIALAKETHEATTWTVDVKPYAASDDVPGAVLPRFAWNSETTSPKGMALYIALKCAALRSQRRRTG